MNGNVPVPFDTFIPGKIGRISVRVKRSNAAGARPIVLVQGSNLTGQSIFDFSFPGGKDYSLMDALVSRGFTAITFAIRGYGKSDPPADPFSVRTEAAMEDLGAVIDWAAQDGFIKPHLLGFSWGGRIAGRYAEDNAAKIARLILYDPARGGGNLVLPAPTAAEGWWTNTFQHYNEKLEPEFTAPEFRKALGDHVVAHEARSPNGIRLENARPVKAIDPTRLKCPTLLVYGVHAAKALYMQGGIERAAFFEQIATDDKSFVILPGGGDFIHLQQGRYRLYDAIASFLKQV